MAEKLSKEFLARLAAVTGKRPRIVVDHILKHGYVTTDDLRDLYGYGHPPRAAMDLREQGIPLEAFRVKGKNKRSIGAYKFGDPNAPHGATQTGRQRFPKKFKLSLVALQGDKCAFCSANFAARDLQIDHRIPYEVGGEAPGELNTADYALACRTCNRGKSWSCEHCQNWLVTKDQTVCQSCFWGNPLSYTHIALRPIRRLNLVWSEEEVKDHDALAAESQESEIELPDYVKAILKKHLEQ